MTDDPALSFTIEDARAFRTRFGLRALADDQLEALADAMTRIAQAGRTVTRVSSKFDSPAPVFTLPTLRARSATDPDSQT